MIIPGICSLTLKTLSPEEVIRFASDHQLKAIEWWAGGHVIPGEVGRAAEVGRLTREAGITVSSYGSYYRAGVSEAAGMPFAPVLDAAVALGAPTIRIWAGNKNPAMADAAWVAQVIADTNRIADLAANQGVSITFEFHDGTLTNSNENVRLFAEQVPHPNVYFSWQPPHGFSQEHSVSGLAGLIPRLTTLHCFHWTIGSYDKNLFNEIERVLSRPADYYRHPLADGRSRWQAYIEKARTSGRDHCVLLEFVKGDTVAQASADAAELVELCRD